MLHLLYILAFTVIAFLAIGNLVRSLINLSTEAGRRYSSAQNTPEGRNMQRRVGRYTDNQIPHPELLDKDGKPINEPLLVMRSVNVEDAREQLDAIFNASPSRSQEDEEK